MKRPRIIPILGIQNRKLVKTVKFKKPKYLGDPINAIKIFNDKEVDELSIIDIRASVDNKEPDYEHIYDMAGEAFMPLSYGGGVSSFEIAKRVFECGIEKVVINSAFFVNPGLVDEIASTYGNQSVVVSLDVSKNWLGKTVVCSRSGGKHVGKSIDQFLTKVSESNAGEILLNDITREGTFTEYDFDLIAYVSKKSKIPVIANGGARDANSIKLGLEAGASALAASSMFVFKNMNTNSILINYLSFTEIFGNGK